MVHAGVLSHENVEKIETLGKKRSSICDHVFHDVLLVLKRF
jgi:hypothetical protein